MDNEGLSIVNMVDGEAIRQVDEAIDEVMHDIADLNTPRKTKRQVTLTLTFAATDDDRQIVVVTSNVSKKLGGITGAAGKIMLGVQGGKVVWSELPSRQTIMTFDGSEDDGEEEVDEDGVVTPITRNGGAR